MPMPNALFICGKNRLRSPTAEQVFASWPGWQVASAGISHDADSRVTPEVLEWADVIFVMESAHRARLSAQFMASLRNKRIVCLDIPDDYRYMQPELVDLLNARVPPHLK